MLIKIRIYGFENIVSINITGLVLASGGSSRMGKDKAGLKYNNKSFLNVAIDHLKAANCAEVYVNNADNLTDIIANLGPLGGIYTALTTQPNAQYWLIIPIDMPLLTPQIFDILVAGLADADIVHYQDEVFPLLLKTTDAMHLHIKNLATDSSRTYSMRQFMQPFKVNLLPKPQDSALAFTNINSPQDYKILCA